LWREGGEKSGGNKPFVSSSLSRLCCPLGLSIAQVPTLVSPFPLFWIFDFRPVLSVSCRGVLISEMSRDKKVVRAEREPVSDDSSKRRKLDTHAGASSRDCACTVSFFLGFTDCIWFSLILCPDYALLD